MTYDETLAARIRAALARKKNIDEKKMFGGGAVRADAAGQVRTEVRRLIPTIKYALEKGRQ
jgi:hypothetical protein